MPQTVCVASTVQRSEDLEELGIDAFTGRRIHRPRDEAFLLLSITAHSPLEFDAVQLHLKAHLPSMSDAPRIASCVCFNNVGTLLMLSAISDSNHFRIHRMMLVLTPVGGLCRLVCISIQGATVGTESRTPKAPPSGRV
jgi:hypothetical protein